MLIFGPWNPTESGLFLLGLSTYKPFALIGLFASTLKVEFEMLVASWLTNLWPSLSKILIAKGCTFLSSMPLNKLRASSIFFLH